jgi:hypothetical protein
MLGNVQENMERIVNAADPVAVDQSFIGFGTPLGGDEFYGDTRVISLNILRNGTDPIGQAVSLMTTAVKNIQAELDKETLNTTLVKAMAVQENSPGSPNLFTPEFDAAVVAHMTNDLNRTLFNKIIASATDLGVNAAAATPETIVEAISDTIDTMRIGLNNENAIIRVWLPAAVLSALRRALVGATATTWEDMLWKNPMTTFRAHMMDGSTVVIMSETHIKTTTYRTPHVNSEEIHNEMLHRFYHYSVPALRVIRKQGDPLVKFTLPAAAARRQPAALITEAAETPLEAAEEPGGFFGRRKNGGSH